MDIKIFGWEKASEYVPLEPTYAIRILNGPSWDVNKDYPPLIESPNYKQIKEYTFDDVDLEYCPNPRKDIFIDEKIAGKMLIDFRDGREGCLAFLVHCSRGQNRSPAVAIAFNEIFNLGQDGKVMREIYKARNVYVYEMLIETAKGLKLIS